MPIPTHESLNCKPVVAHVTLLECLGRESQLFPPSAREGLDRDFTVWQLSVQVDEELFGPVILGDDGAGTVCFYGFGEDPATFATAMPEQARLLAYLHQRTAQLLARLGPISIAFEGASEAAERTVIRAYAAARGFSSQD